MDDNNQGLDEDGNEGMMKIWTKMANDYNQGLDIEDEGLHIEDEGLDNDDEGFDSQHEDLDNEDEGFDSEDERLDNEDERLDNDGYIWNQYLCQSHHTSADAAIVFVTRTSLPWYSSADPAVKIERFQRMLI